MSLKHSSLRRLRVYEAVARHRSFSRAAAELHLTQPAVSMQVQQLEAEIGLQLCEHMGRRIDIAAAGREVADCARAVQLRPRETIEMGSNETNKQAVMAGMGLSFLSLHTVGLEAAARRLALLAVSGTPVMRDW